MVEDFLNHLQTAHICSYFAVQTGRGWFEDQENTSAVEGHARADAIDFECSGGLGAFEEGSRMVEEVFNYFRTADVLIACASKDS